METNKPTKTIRHGNVKAAIWANQGEKGEFYTVTFARVYRDGESLKDSRSFGLYDLFPLIRCAVEVHTWLPKPARNSAPATDAAA